MTAQDKPSTLKIWLVAIRPFSLPASVMPVIFGTALAVTVGHAMFRLWLFLASLFGMAMLHCGANLLNDVYDYRKHVDRQINPVSGAVVRKWLTPQQALAGAWILFFLGTALGFWIVSQVGMLILYLGAIGLLIGIAYSWGPWPLKFYALGDLAVFLNFGILGALGAWTVQTGSFSWIPAVWTIPMSLLVIGILHANNWRDIQSDARVHIKTVANLMGDQGSKFYYRFLLFGPFACILLIISGSRLLNTNVPMPWIFLITFLSLPLAVQLDKKGDYRKQADQIQIFLALDGATAQLNLLFGLLCTTAAILSIWLG